MNNLLARSLSELRSPDAIQENMRRGKSVLIPAAVLIWLGAVLMHDTTPFIPNLFLVHVVFTFFVIEMTLLSILEFTYISPQLIYFAHFTLDLLVAFLLIGVTSDISSIFLILPFLYLLGSMFIHGLIPSIYIFCAALAGYGIIGLIGTNLHSHHNHSHLFTPTMLALGLVLIIFATIWYFVQEEREKVKQLLKASEAKYRTFVESAPELVYTLSKDKGIITSVNSTVEKLLGWSPEDLVSKSFLSFIHPDDFPKTLEIYELLGRGKSIADFEIRLLTKNNQYVWMEFNITPLAQNGEVYGLLGFARDITQRKEAQERLNESEARFRHLSESALDAIILMDGEGKINYWNQAAERIFGYSEEEILGKSIQDTLLPSHLKKMYRRGLVKFRETGTSPIFGKSLELTALRKGGSEFPIELSISRMQIKGAWNAMGIVRDISERRRTLDKIRQLSRQNQLILDSLGEGVYGVDLSGKATFVNPAMVGMVGYDHNELLGQSIHKLIHHSKIDGTVFPSDECPIYAAYRDGTTHRIRDDLFWRKDGSSFSVEYVSTPVIEHGKVVGAVVVFRDITEHKLLEEELRRIHVERERNETMKILTMTYAHNILNVITPIQGYAQLLERSIDPGDHKQKWVKSIISNTKKTTEIIRKLRELERYSPTQFGGETILDIESASSDEDDESVTH